MTQTLTEFLLARIAEDEHEIDFVHSDECAHHETPGFPCDCGVPGRTRSECAAKRRIAARHSRCDDVSYGDASTCPEMRDLASVYADHPDYRQEWQVFARGGYVGGPAQVVELDPDECVLLVTGECVRHDAHGCKEPWNRRQPDRVEPRP